MKQGVTLGINTMRSVHLAIFRIQLLRVQLLVDLYLPLLEKMNLIAGRAADPVLVLGSRQWLTRSRFFLLCLFFQHPDKKIILFRLVARTPLTDKHFLCYGTTALTKTGLDFPLKNILSFS